MVAVAREERRDEGHVALGPGVGEAAIRSADAFLRALLLPEMCVDGGGSGIDGTGRK